jgi:hypothetical protein
MTYILINLIVNKNLFLFKFLINYIVCFQEILDEVRQKLMSNIRNRDRRLWSRSPLNVAASKMRIDVVRMMVIEAGIDINSIDTINHTQRY